MAGLDRYHKQLLDAFFRRNEGFFLTGGAALVGFHLHHRTTLDLALFTTEDVLDDGEAARVGAASALGAGIERLRTSPTFRRLPVSGGCDAVVIGLVHELAPQLDDAKRAVGGVRVNSPREIMANTLCTLLSRAELRDLVDVRALEQASLSVEEHLPLAAQKDGG